MPGNPVEIITGYDNRRSREFKVDINRTTRDTDLLFGVMLGDIASILQSSRQNAINGLLTEKLSRFGSDIVGSRSSQGVWSGLPADIRKVADKYRNSHAHTKQMKREVFVEFRRFMLDGETPLLPRVLTYKAAIFN